MLIFTILMLPIQFSSLQWLSHVWLFATPWTAAHQASLSITNTWSWLRLMSVKLVMPSNYLILYRSVATCFQSFPASGFFQMSQFFSSGGQNTGVSTSASILPMNIQGWFHLGWTGWISLQSKGLPRIFSNTTVQKRQFFGVLDNMRHFRRAEISESYECHEVGLLKSSASICICEIKDK